MKIAKTYAAYQRLRREPLWRLLAANSAPAFIALLQNNLMEGERTVPASILYERLDRDIELLREQGETLPQKAQGYVADWLAQQWLTRRFPSGAAEEEYELSASAARAIHLVSGLVAPRTVVTGSRLATVIQQLIGLIEETDPDPESRMASLVAERKRIERQIEDLRQGKIKTLSDDQAMERIREIIGLSQELVADFRSVRDEFEQLNRDLRESIMADGGSRGEVLDKLFNGIDVIAESESGKTFSAFWRMLTDPEQNAALEDSIEETFNRTFSKHLEPAERRFLTRLIRTLLEQGGVVHEVLQQFARSLKQFVQSREFLEQRRIDRLIRQAQRGALEIKDEIKVTEKLDFPLQLTSSRIRSISQWVLFDPSENMIEKGMAEGGAAEIDLTSIAGLVQQSEIDFRSLSDNIRHCLQDRSQVSIGQVLVTFPATQGLGSVVGYVALGSRHGEPIARRGETVSWIGEDQQQRRARIPLIYFLQERCDELV